MTIITTPIQFHPRPWEAARSVLGYAVCGEEPGQMRLVRSQEVAGVPRFARLFDSLDRAMSAATPDAQGRPDPAWILRAIPDQGTTVRLGAPRRLTCLDFDEAVARLGDTP